MTLNQRQLDQTRHIFLQLIK